MDGPVIKDAQAALASGDVTPVLKWVKPKAEATIREIFRRALAVRAMGPEARDLADQLFFETLVRVHREGEGAPYMGIEPAGTAIDPAIAAADEALDKASVEVLAKMLTTEIDNGLRERFGRAVEAKKHAAEDVEGGRAYVSAYVEFMHYAERLHGDAVTVSHADHEAPGGSAHRH